MLHGCDRVRNTQHRAHLVHPVTGCVHDHFAGNVTLLSMDDEFAVSFTGNVFYRVEAVYLSTCLTGIACQRESQLCGIDVAIQRIPPGTQ